MLVVLWVLGWRRVLRGSVLEVWVLRWPVVRVCRVQPVVLPVLVVPVLVVLARVRRVRVVVWV
ncbi:hypothetical protein GCM10022198_24710 [Klugiella xanthotipulae]